MNMYWSSIFLKTNSMRLALLFVALLSYQGIAQLSGSNLLEYSYGKLPNENEKSFHAAYSKPILNYRWDNIKAVVGLKNTMAKSQMEY